MSPETPAIEIDGRRIAADMPPFVLAEIGLNHGGSVERALALVDAAADSGAHAVKLQTIEAAALVAPSCPAPVHVEAGSLVDFFTTFELGEQAHERLAARARQRGLRLVSTPLSEPSVDLLERLGIDAFKIASGDLTWDGLIARVAATGKPIIMSTGMATLAEVEHALAIARRAGARAIALLHCVSSYPVPPGSENLLAIRTMADRCSVPVGLSDHGGDTFAYPLAVALGASLYERHLVLADDVEAIDRPVSSTPDDLSAAIDAGRRAWTMLGTGRKMCIPAEAPNRTPSRRSLCAARPLAAGTRLSGTDLVALRPATGLPPAHLPQVVGMRLRRPLEQGEALTSDVLEPGDGGEAHRVA
jgi:sialic acid synthase SpsE